MTASTTPPQGNLFVGLKDKKTSERGNYMNEGKYQVRVNKVVRLEKVRATGSPAYIVEFDVVKSSRPAIIERLTNESLEDYEKRCAKAPNAVGTTGSWFQNLKDIDVGYSALKSFAANITGSNPNDPEFIADVEQWLTQTVKGEPDEEGNFVPGAPSIIFGWLLPLEVSVVMTKKNQPFSLYRWGKRIEEDSKITNPAVGRA